MYGGIRGGVSGMRVILVWPAGMRGGDWMLFPLGYGFLRNAVPCDIVDSSLADLDNDRLAERCRGYDVVGISVWGINIAPVEDLIARIRANSDSIIIAGGPAAGQVDADYALVGEAETRFAALIAALASGDENALAAIEGLGIRGRVKALMPRTHTADLDSLGSVDYDALKLGAYIAHGYKYWMYSLKDKAPTGPIMATRGCPYHCNFCAGPKLQGTKLRKHSIGYILDAIETLYDKHGIRQISFLDDNLTLDARWAKELCEAIVALKQRRRMEFVCTTSNGVRYKTLDKELLLLMRRAGWGEIVLAPESGSLRTLERMCKQLDLDMISRKVDLIHQCGLNAVGFFMAGYPGEEPQDLDDTRDYIRNSRFDRAIVNLFNPIPGTPVYEELVASGEIQPRPVRLNYSRVEDLQYVTPGLSREKLAAFQADVEPKSRFREMWMKDLPAAA